MTFEHAGETYRIEFERILALPRQKAVPSKAAIKQHEIAEKHRAEKASRKGYTYVAHEAPEGRPPATLARLTRLVKLGEILASSTPQWVEVMRATVRHYFKDTYTVEMGRKKALQCLTPFILPALRPPMWKAYLERPRPHGIKQTPVLERELHGEDARRGE